jgi:DNA-directed RNA polymerase specialized sigma24 family protein
MDVATKEKMTSMQTSRRISICSQKEMNEFTLKRFDDYIETQVKLLMYHHPTIAHPAVLDLEIDELIQCVRVKFWLALERKSIFSPHSYIKRIIHNEFINMIRRQKPLLPLLADDTEECYRFQFGVLLDEYESMPDPADEIEQQMEDLSCLKETVQMVLKLPPRQQLAMICLLQETVDDLVQLINAFKEYGADIRTLQWPTEKAEKNVLQASLSAARRKLEQSPKMRSRLKRSRQRGSKF